MENSSHSDEVNTGSSAAGSSSCINRMQMAEKTRFGKKFAVVVALVQLTFIVLFAFFVDYEVSAVPQLGTGHSKEAETTEEMAKHYSFFQDIHVMIFLGIGFLYSFMKRYCFTGISMCMLLAAITIQAALLTQNIWRTVEGKVPINIATLIMTEFAAASSLIALGGIFGKVSPLQMVIFVLAETFFYSVNEYWSLKFLQVTDLGESVALHLFAAVFGLSVAYVVDRNKKVSGNENDATGYSSNIFCLIGTIVLWTLWPSFNAALSTADAQHRSALNTFLALVASCVSAFFTSALLNKESKFCMTHIQNATLAGGVAVGAAADLMIRPAGALGIGVMGGVLSVLGFTYATPFLEKRMKLYDPCGINSLHAIPGAFGGIVGAIVALTASEATYGHSLYSLYPAMAPLANTTLLSDLQAIDSSIQAGSQRTATLQAAYQLAYIAFCIVTSIVTGLLTGLVVRLPIFDPLSEDQMYTDATFWDMSKETEEEFQNVTSDGNQHKF